MLSFLKQRLTAYWGWQLLCNCHDMCPEWTKLSNESQAKKYVNEDKGDGFDDGSA